MNKEWQQEEYLPAKAQSLERTVSHLVEGEEDPPVQAFFSTLKRVWNQNQVRRVIETIISRRPTIEDEHLAYLLFIASQYVTDFGYDEFNQLPETERVEALLQTLETQGGKIIELCRTKNASTNIVERYAGLQIILALMGRKEVTVVDFGTSLGLGLLAINHPESFSKIRIKDNELKTFLNTRVSVKELIGVDEQDRDLNDLKWCRACLLPGYRENRESFGQTLARIGAEKDITFVHGNFLNLGDLKTIPPHSADVVWTSNVLYTIASTKEAAYKRVKPSVLYIAKPDAIFIDADYQSWENDFTAEDNPYVYTARLVQDWKRPLEVLEAPRLTPGIPKDAVLSLKKGQDFLGFVQSIREHLSVA